MIETSIPEFPLDEVSARIEGMLQLIPTVGRGLTIFQQEVRIRDSDAASSDYALMTRADHYAEAPMMEYIKANFPKDQIRSEDAEPHYGREGDFTWWLDPVDGSRNFIHGVPLYSISAGLAFRDQPVAGIVHAPALKDTYHAVYGSGAYKNGTPIQVSGISQVDRSLVTIGIPYQRNEIISQLISDISSFVTSSTGLRRTGSVILDLCWIAEGRFEAQWEQHVNPWDTCAASVILQEAGGRITGFKGEHFSIDLKDIVASNSAVHDDMLRILRDSRRVQGIN